MIINSPDNTITIIEEFINQHPNGYKIKFLNNKENMGIMPNLINTLKIVMAILLPCAKVMTIG